LAVGRDGSCRLLIETTAEPSLPVLRHRLAGVDANWYPSLHVQGRGEAGYLSLRCKAPEYLSPFTRVVQDIALLVLGRGVAPLEAIRQTTGLWRAFWRSEVPPPLSKQAQVGLLGELLVLQHLQTRLPAVGAWRGPEGDRNDFRWGHYALEVKTCVGLPAHHVIDGVDQLDPSPGTALALASVVLEGVSDGPITLPGTVDAVLDRTSPEERDDLLGKLSAVGYSPVHAWAYLESHYDLVGVSVYTVDDSFPKVVPTSFVPPLSPRVRRLTYEIALSGLEGQGLGEYVAAVSRTAA